MKKSLIARSSLLRDNSANEIIAESSKMLSNYGVDDNYIDYYAEGVTGLLNDYAELTGEGTEVLYSLKKKLTKIELRLLIPGESFDPFTSGTEAKKRLAEKLNDLNLNTDIPTVSYRYIPNKNAVTISVPLTDATKPFFRSPMLTAIVLGVVLGLVCQHLPDNISSFILDDLASPIQTKLLGVISGIMGPYIFISMTTSIISMKSIKELTDLGWKIVKRFLGIILFIIAICLLVSALFFNSFGTASLSYSADQLIEMVLDIIPTNLINPFVENNTAQLVVLGILLGSALLLLDDKVTGLNDLLTQADEWIVSAMNIVLKITPVIPFLSLLTMIGKGNFSFIFKGWKWIAAVYIAFAVAVIVKMIKMSVVTGTGIPDFWNRAKPVIKTAFTTGSSAACMKQIYEVSDQELDIDPGFTSFWVPLCSSMLGIKTAVYLITATLMTAEISGIALTNSFLFVMILVTTELSLANPGAASAWATMFSVLGLSTDYVGLFSTFRMFTENFSAAANMTYCMLEQYEAAHKLGGMKTSS